MTALAYAKINLGLRVIRKRGDGFHDIETIFHRVGLHDVIEVREAGDISVESTDPAAPSDQTNLAHRAAVLMKEAGGVRGGVSITITKNIPVGAGLGGGSSDAATVLMMLEELWRVRLRPGRLQDMALSLGSDVPYFLRRGSAVAYGRGERLTYFDLDLPFAVLLVTPGIHVSTAWAYRSVTPRGAGTEPPLQGELTDALPDPDRMQRALTNDFEPPVFTGFPAIADVKRTMLATGALAASMSGSGSSVFGFYPSTGSAETAARPFRAPGVTVHVTPPHFTP